MNFKFRLNALIQAIVLAIISSTAQAGGLPFAGMAAITGDITGNVLTLNGDVNPNEFIVVYVPGLPGYAISTDMADTITITDNDGNATLLGNGTDAVSVQINPANLDSVGLFGGEGDDVFFLSLINHPFVVRGNQNNDTVTVSQGGDVDIAMGQNDDIITLAAGVIAGPVNGNNGNDTLQILGGGTTVDLGVSEAAGYSGTTTRISSGFSRINTLTAANGSNTLRAREVVGTNTWEIDGTNTHNNGTHTLNFSGFQVLEGSGLSNDNFTVSTDTNITIDGVGADNSLTLITNTIFSSSFTGGTGIDVINIGRALQTVTLTDETPEGWNGTAVSPASFFGVETLNSSGANTTLHKDFQPDAIPAVWDIDATPTLTYQGESTLNWSGFDDIEGHSEDNIFNLSVEFDGEIRGAGNRDELNISNGGSISGPGIFIGGQGSEDLLTSTDNGFDAVISGFNDSGSGYRGSANSVNLWNGVDRIQHLGNNGSVKGENIPATWTLNTGSFVEYDAGYSRPFEIDDFDRLIGNNSGNDFIVTVLSPINITGGSGVDRLELNNTLDGDFQGNQGEDTIEINAFNDLFTLTTSSPVTGFSGTSGSVTGGFTGVNTLTNNGPNGTLEGGPSATADPVIWDLDGTPTVDDNVAILNFSGFATLVGDASGNIFNVSVNTTLDINGGTGDDTLNLTAGAALTGSFDGAAQGSSGDAITSTANNFDIVLTSGDTNGYAGTAPGISGGFLNVDALEALGNDSSFTGINSLSDWSLGTANSYINNVTEQPEGAGGQLVFSGFTTINGGNQPDIFTISENKTLDIDGGGGADNFTINAGRTLTGSIDGSFDADLLTLLTDPAEVVLSGENGFGFDGTATQITGTFSNIDSIFAPGDGSSITGLAANCSWVIDTTSSLTFNQTLEFGGFEVLNGCTGENDVDVNAPLPASVSSIWFNGNAADDVATLDMAGGDLNMPFTFVGGSQTTASGDRLELTNLTADTVNYQFGTQGVTPVNGNLLITNQSTIGFDDIETMAEPPAGTTTVIADFQPFLGLLELQDNAGGEWALVLDGKTHLSTNNAIDLLIVRPPETDFSTNRFEINELNFLDADLTVTDTPDPNMIVFNGPVNMPVDRRIDVDADHIELDGAINLTGTGRLSFDSNTDIEALSASASIITDGGFIGLDADSDENQSGSLILAAGSTIGNGTGQIEINADDMELFGAINGDDIQMYASTDDGVFLLGGPIGGANQNAPQGSGPTITLSVDELDGITANELAFGDNSHAGIWITDNLDFTGQVPLLILSTDSNAPIGDNNLTGTDLIVDELRIRGKLSPDVGGLHGIFELQGELNARVGTTFDIRIAGTTPGGEPAGHDQVSVIGTVNLTGSGFPTLDVTIPFGFEPGANDEYVIINNDGGDAITGMFDGLSEGTIFAENGVDLQISYVGGDGNDVVLTVQGVDPDVLFRSGFENN